MTASETACAKAQTASRAARFETHKGGSGHITVRRGNRVTQLPTQGSHKDLGKKLVNKISKQADERYQELRESELLLLIRDDDGLIEKLSRYQVSLMNAASRVIQQLRLVKIMKGPTKLIAVE